MFLETNMVTEIIGVFLEAIKTLLGGIGEGIVDVFNTLIYDPLTGLTPVATWAILFMGIGFALGIFRIILRKIT